MINQQLMDYFKFDQADLIANQGGQFTAKQSAQIVKNDRSDRSGSIIAGIFLIFIGAIGLGIAVLAVVNDQNWGFRIVFGLGFGCIWPLVWGGIGYIMLSSSFGKHEFVLAKVQGRVNIVRQESHSSSSHTTRIRHELHIGGKEFDVEGNIADVLMQGDEYIIYYIANTDKIVSAEWVSSEAR